jgi:hypothetical protein
VDRVFISWSIENWITVMLMVGLGYLLFALAAQVFRNYARPRIAA